MTRIATAHSYETTIATLQKRQNDLSQQQERISTGKRVLRASDDPVAAVMAEAARNRQERAAFDQRSIEASRTSLSQVESALGDATELIQQVRELFIAAGNATYTPREHKDLAQQIEGLRDELLAVANRTDTSGRTLFGGLGGSSLPFVEVQGPSGGGVQFQGQRGQEAATSSSLPQSMDGHAVFMRVPQGNGVFDPSLPATNTGSVRTDIGEVTDPAALTGNDYAISFADVGGGVIEYTVTNVTTGTPVPGQVNQPYQSGMQIGFDGMAVQVSGMPANGDSVDLTAVTASTDIFQVMQDAIDALRTSDTTTSAALTQSVGNATSELDAGLDRIMQARSAAGAWLNRADSTDMLLSDRQAALEGEISNLEDVDLVEAISDFQNQQVGLQAALQSYAQVQRLSLFQYIG
ncbi:flagellar hook-associated protein FlgL [Hydrogenophaga sp. 5NK40-0174]|uniref:flagellar hook-associated protein FlgL n=1 Tax=Hydrogenophaga sp. 5NK40-0174 TaxID=3127649 RepID=UPI003101E919